MQQELLEIKPVSILLRYRGTLVPPNYNIAKIDVSAALAEKFAEAFNLTSKDIIFNQNALGTSFLAFRSFMSAQGNFFSYLDVSIGADQAEIAFTNPLTLAAVKQEFSKVWEPLIKISKPKIAQHYFEVNIDSSAQEKSGRKFLDQFVTIQLHSPYKLIGKGISLNADTESGGRLHLNIQDSLVTPDGIFLFCTYTLKKTIGDMQQLGSLLESVIGYYHQVQPMVHVKVLEQQ
jgi:hypothetical protein